MENKIEDKADGVIRFEYCKSNRLRFYLRLESQ
jgi:hypothetical protein